MTSRAVRMRQCSSPNVAAGMSSLARFRLCGPAQCPTLPPSPSQSLHLASRRAPSDRSLLATIRAAFAPRFRVASASPTPRRDHGRGRRLRRLLEHLERAGFFVLRSCRRFRRGGRARSRRLGCSVGAPLKLPPRVKALRGAACATCAQTRSRIRGRFGLHVSHMVSRGPRPEMGAAPRSGPMRPRRGGRGRRPGSGRRSLVSLSEARKRRKGQRGAEAN